jgi:putative ATP-dependent endonuclease of OLD family
LFFARAVILVEGAAERALLPAVSECLGVNLRHCGITVVSTDGLNFDCFQPLFGERSIPIKLATLTDRDPSDILYPALGQAATASAAAATSLAMDETFRRTFIGAKTLEYDLALQSSENRHLMLDALAVLHPLISADLRRQVDAQPDNTSAARCLFQGMFERPNGARNVSKGAFAQELADKIREQPDRFTTPAYIRNALDWVRIPAPPTEPAPLAPPVEAGVVPHAA